MGLFDFITGRKRPTSNAAPQPAEAVRRAILELNRDTAPYTVRVATPEEGGELIAEWRIVDAQWWEIFAKARLEKSFSVLMRLDEPTHQVRSMEKSRTLEWSAGVPNMSARLEGARGRQATVEFGAAYAFTEELRPGEVYRYRFNSSEIKGPLQQAVTAQGWTWRSVAFSGV